MSKMFRKFVEDSNLPEYRLQQLYQLYYNKPIESWDELTTWPLELREKLKKKIPFWKLQKFQEVTSEDGRTIKLLSFTKEGYPVETVLMKSNRRNTLCISCMSGCPVGCTFCATGQMGFNKKLDSQEIIDQVLYFKRRYRENITNIVFMGMGEPMLNLKNVIEASEILTDTERIGMGRRRITLSTVGYIKPLKKFLAKNLGVKIAISLHAPEQRLRESLMPTVASQNPLDELIKVLDDYQHKSNKKITYEYLLIKDVNDSIEHAEALAKLIKNQIALVNLIRFNPSPNIVFEPSSSKSIRAFQHILDEKNITNTLRHSYGNDIKAACGQLANLCK